MNVLVTGGAGYIGSVTAEQLLDQGHEVHVFDNLSRGHREAVDPRAKFILGDLQRPDDILDAMRSVKPDAVMHFAAYALVGESMQQPEIYFANNVVGGLNLVEAMRKVGVSRIIFSSTCATYGQPERVPIAEDTPQRPANPYGESKLAFEKMLSWYQQIHRIQAVFLRYFNACGATERYGEDHDPEAHLIPNVLKVALGQQEKVGIFGDDYDTPDGTCIRDYIHVADLAAAHVLALQHLEAGNPSGIFNCGYGHGYSVREIVAAVKRVSGVDFPVVESGRRAGDPPALISDPSRIRATMAWVPRHDDIEAIALSAYAWEKGL